MSGGLNRKTFAYLFLHLVWTNLSVTICTNKIIYWFTMFWQTLLVHDTEWQIADQWTQWNRIYKLICNKIKYQTYYNNDSVRSQLFFEIFNLSNAATKYCAPKKKETMSTWVYNIFKRQHNSIIWQEKMNNQHISWVLKMWKQIFLFALSIQHLFGVSHWFQVSFFNHQ